MERAIPCELPFFYFRSAQFNSSKNITFVPNLQEIFKVAKRTFLYINLVIALFFVLPVSQAKEKTFTVVIDAGHGGKDPGARGSSINEKAIPKETAHGALAHYISNPEIRDFQPMNVNFGLLPSLGKKIRNKKEKNALIAERSLNALQDVLQIIK